jgi:hypothetical protein
MSRRAGAQVVISNQMNYESIADRLDIPLGTMRSRLARTLWALQQAQGRDDSQESWRASGTSSRATAPFAVNTLTDGQTAKDAKPAPKNIVCLLASYYFVFLGIITFA